MAHKKAGGSSRNGRDSAGRRLGIKKFGGEAVIPGNIIIRQRGTRYNPGENVGIGKDHTLFALTEGRVVVQPGNSLWRIARRTLGEGMAFSVIYDANKNQIRDPDLIYPGQVFVLPERE